MLEHRQILDADVRKSLYEYRISVKHGTREGVNIYNSNKMAVYKAWIQNGNRPDQKILIGNEVSAITGSQNGDVFLIVDHALLKYDIRKETFKRLRQGSVYALTSHAGEIWCAGHDSIFGFRIAVHRS